MSYFKIRSAGIVAAVTFSLLAGLLIGSLSSNALTAQAQPPFEVIEGRPDGIVRPRPNVHEAIDRLEAKLDRQEAKLDRLARAVAQNSRIINHVNEGVQKLEGKLDRLPGNGEPGEAIDRLEAKLDRLVFEHVEHILEGLAALEGKLDRPADAQE